MPVRVMCTHRHMYACMHYVCMSFGICVLVKFHPVIKQDQYSEVAQRRRYSVGETGELSASEDLRST